MGTSIFLSNMGTSIFLSDMANIWEDWLYIYMMACFIFLILRENFVLNLTFRCSQSVMQHFVIAILFLIQTWTCKYFYIKSAWYVSTHTRTVILSLGYSYVTFPQKSWSSYECGSENSSNSVQALLKIFIKKLKKIF